MLILDANIILRYLLDDNAVMAQKAEEYLAAGNAWVTVEVVAEVVYVLKGVYSLKREIIAETVKAFLAMVNCQEKAVLHAALDSYAGNTLDFVDCVLYAYHAVNGAVIATFDKKLLKLLAGPDGQKGVAVGFEDAGGNVSGALHGEA